MKSKITQKTLSLSRGDFLLSKKLVPHPDGILVPEVLFKNERIYIGKEKIYIGVLDNYLKFLELIVTNQRIVNIDFSTYTDAEEKSIGKKDLELYFYQEFRLKKPILEEKMLKELKAKNIYFPAFIKSIDFSPRKHVEQYLSISPQLKNLFKETKKHTPVEFKKNSDLISHIALAEDIGIPLSVVEVAKFTSLPFALHKIEMRATKEIESAELNLQHGVTAFLRESLSKGAQKEIENINGLGNKIIYPETPIAWQIIRDSSKIEDFLPVALQLRDEYKTFRETTAKIEEEFFSDAVTLVRKKQLAKEISLMANEIWKNQENTTQQIAQDFSSILDLALNQTANLSIGNLPKLLEFILGKPTEILLSKLRQRKIKVLINSKKQFMTSRHWVGKLSSIFSMAESSIKKSILDFHKMNKD